MPRIIHGSNEDQANFTHPRGNKMNQQEREQARKIAEDHWKYTERFLNAVLGTEDISPKTRRICKFLYEEGMIHGFKHGKEDEYP